MARVRSIPTRAEQLALEPSIPARHRALLAQGAAQWDAREFFDAHETWEDIWQEEERPIRGFWQGIILLAAGLHHWRGKGNPKGLQIKLAGGIERLAPYAPAYAGVDAAAAIGDAARLLSEAAGRSPEQLAATPDEAFPPFRWLRADAPPAQPPAPALFVQRLRPTAALPTRGSELASGLDLYADLGGEGESMLLTPGVTLVPTGIAIQPPPGMEAQIRPRSSFSGRGIETSFGTIDADYRGELLIGLALRGPVGRERRIRHGERIAQLVVAPVALCEVVELDQLDATARGAGGFGSTGR